MDVPLTRAALRNGAAAGISPALPRVPMRSPFVVLPILAACAPPDSAELLELTDGCDPVAGVQTLKTDGGAAPSVKVCKLEGAVWWRADMDVDCDGSTSDVCLGAPGYDAGTAAVGPDGESVSATETAYVTVPPPATFDYEAAGIALGNAVAVIHRDKLVYAPVANEGEEDLVGEGSYALAVALGLNPDEGADKNVTFIVFTGDATVTPIDSADAAQEIGEERARDLVRDNK